MVGGGGWGASCALLVVSLASTRWLPLAPPNPSVTPGMSQTQLSAPWGQSRRG